MKIKPWLGIVVSLICGFIGIFILFRISEPIKFVNINILWLFVSVVIFLIWWSSDSFSLKVIADGLKIKLTFLESLKIIYSSFFFGAVTPFNSGMIPAEIFFLKIKGAGLCSALPTVMMKALINGILRGILAIILGLYFYKTLGSIIGKVMLSILLMYGVIVFSTYIVIINQSKTSYKIRILIVKIIDFIGSKLRFLRKITNSLSSSILNGPENMSLLLKNPSWLPKAILFALLVWVSQITLPYFILRSININSDFFNVFIAQASFYLLQPYMPTPGGSGIAELSFGYLSSSIIGITPALFTFLWRFFSFYLPSIIGAVLMIPNIRKIDKF